VEKIIVAGRGTHFDPAVVDAFLAVAPLFEQVSPGAPEPPGDGSDHSSIALDVIASR
jgi:hypothetical protein